MDIVKNKLHAPPFSPPLSSLPPLSFSLPLPSPSSPPLSPLPFLPSPFSPPPPPLPLLPQNLKLSIMGTDYYCGFLFSSTQLFLPDFIKHINDPVPSKVRLFLDFESEEPLPDFLTSEEVTLDKLYVQTSVIASPLSEEDLENNSSSCTETETEDIPIS